MIEPRITELAEKLGQAIAEAERVRKFKKLHAEVMADPQAQELVRALRRLEQEIARKQQENKPIEVADKHRLRDLRERTYANEKLKALMAAEADYFEMIQQVNDLIARHLVSPEELARDSQAQQPGEASAADPQPPVQ